MRKRIKQIVIALLLLAGVFFMGTYYLQEKFIFLPTKLEQDYQYSFDADFEELFFETEDGARLNALHLKAEKPRGIIVYYHGNAGDLSRWGSICTYFLEHNYDVLVWDYRTYGKSTGKLSEAAMYEDAKLIYKKAMEWYPEDKIVVYGRSLGTGLASFVASKYEPRRLILETPFYDFTSLVKEKVPYLPVDRLLKYRFNNAKHVDDVKCRIIIIHGDQDSVVPQSHGTRLYQVIPEELRKFVGIPGGKHNDLINFDKYRLTIYKELLE